MSSIPAQDHTYIKCIGAWPQELTVYVQITPKTACRDMGFVSGFFMDVNVFLKDVDASVPLLLPPWLSGIRCAGTEDSLGDCTRSGFGETASCGGFIQRLFCFSSSSGTFLLYYQLCICFLVDGHGVRFGLHKISFCTTCALLANTDGNFT